MQRSSTTKLSRNKPFASTDLLTISEVLYRKLKLIGENFHQVVLENKAEILKKFKIIKAIPTIEKLDDSLKLM